MKRFRLLLAVPAVLLLVGCSDPVAPLEEGEHPKEEPPDTKAFIVDLEQPPILV